MDEPDQTAGPSQGDGKTRASASAADVGVESFAELARSLARVASGLSNDVTASSRNALENALHGTPAGEVVSTTLAELVVRTRETLEAELDRRGQPPETRHPRSGGASPVADAATSTPAASAPGTRDDELRRLADSLLSRSRSLDDPDEHPAMSRVLHEISPDEARIIRFLGETGPHAVIDVLAHNPWTRKFRDLVHNASMVGREAGCARPEDTPIYLDNLSRLGVVAIRAHRMRSQPNYDFILAQPEVMHLEKPVGRLVRLKHVYKGVELSLFGRELFRAAFETETSKLAPVPDVL